MPEGDLERVTVEAINQALAGKDEFLATLEQNIAAVLNAENDDALTEIDRRLDEQQNELLKRTAARADYEDVAEEIYRLREQKQKVQAESAENDELRKRMADMSAFLREQPTAAVELDEQLVQRLVEKVTVYEDRFMVEFKSGVMVDISNL